MLMHFIFKFNWHQWLPRLIFIWAPPRTLGKIQLPCYIIWTGTTTASICEIRILSHEGGVLWGPPTRVVLAGGGHCWPPQHFDGGVKFVPCICTLYCSDSSGCNTRIKVKHQITKLLTKVLTHADALRWDRMHYGETECLKQRCVHQQVSDSSGWLMLMHFIFKFNALIPSLRTWRKIMRFHQKASCKPSNDCHTLTSPAQKLKASLHWSQVCAPGAKSCGFTKS